MLATELKQGHSYQFEVLKDRSSRKFFKIRTDDGVVFSLQKFRFQINQPLPDSIRCYVKSLYPLTLGQDISVFIKDFYTEGEEYNFKIKAIKSDIVQIYELEDDHDLCFRLYNAPDSLAIGSRVKCKIMKIRGINVTLKYMGTLSTRLPLDFIDISQWLSHLGIHRHHEKYLSLIESIPAFQTSLLKYDEESPEWIIELLKASATNITDWLIACKDNRRMLSKTIARMRLARRLTLFIIEESDYLRNCDAEQRSMLQSKLSYYVELFDQYEQAAAKIQDKTYEDFIDKMFSRLKKAGYLYNPFKQFRIMMTILKLRPELIKTRMGELFEALHNWELSNWQSEPFRGALVQQLQIFIKENCNIINRLPAKDSSEDNKALIRMILAIAVQSILATESDDVDLTINRAMLYRYISYLNPSNVDTLLDKGLDTLMGSDHPSEFSWNDTEHPTLLVEKASHPFTYTEERENLVKTYSTSKATVRLRGSFIHIIAKNANPESTCIPNNLIEWLSPKISIEDDIKVQNIRKTKDLKTYEKLWDEIHWSIFGIEESAGIQIEKKIPFNGEDVRIIIDDYRILDHGPEKQRLQFHCTIHDDIYVGEGWMPCDSYHMIGWLSSRDIPGNYDGSLAFATDTKGNPLLFYATVSVRNENLVFSMKSQIEDYLLENLWAGEESICIVTHLDYRNNVWLCLSEKGCTYKVHYDDTTAHLFEGMLVRIKHVEPDRSSTTTQFFIGELTENQEDIPSAIKKSLCLYNLMQGLGEANGSTPDEDSTVVEIEEVMSREELLEIIYMYQRRALYETEYIKAFNYLGFATLLCKIAEEKTLMHELATHMELLRLLQDFGRNQRIDTEWLYDCEEKVQVSPMLERIFTRLKIVANIDLGENTDWLWNIRMNPRNDIEQRLASLVLSYNMLPKELERTRKEIMKEITTLLNVNNTVTSSKYYGDESQTVEFKSSLIFPSGGGGRPDYKAQLHEITHIICGFMNARGGTLYIGVNDSGYESGLEDDIAYRRSHGFKPSIDGMIVDLQNHLHRVIPYATDHCEIESDEESKKGVIRVKVLPVKHPVEYEGVIYVRSSSTTKPRLDDQREEFIKNRSHNYQLLMKLWGVGIDKESPKSLDNHDNGDTKLIENGVSNNDCPATETESVQSAPSDENETVKITTGKHRLNVLHNYEPNYVLPHLYLYFLKDSIKPSIEDAFTDYEAGCRLAIAVNEREKDGVLIMCYEDGNISKYPIQEFALFAKNETRKLRSGSILKFVNIANEDDYLLSVIKAPFGGLFYRVDSISKLAYARQLDFSGNPVCENMHYILIQEIVTKEKLAFIDREAIDRESRFYGLTVPQGDGAYTEKERIERLIKPIAHSE